MSIDVLVAEDEPMARECMVKVLESDGDFRIVGQATDGREALSMADSLRPSVALVDVDLPVINGIDVVRRLRRQSVPAVIVCTAHRDGSAAADAALQAGAAAYLDSRCEPRDFLDSIRSAAQGNAARRVTTTEKGAFAALTPREREVLQLLSEGRAAKDISEMLGMSIKTVSAHRVRIKDKVGAQSMASLTKYAIREGLSRL